jgi:hypothetical protein
MIMAGDKTGKYYKEGLIERDIEPIEIETCRQGNLIEKRGIRFICKMRLYIFKLSWQSDGNLEAFF